MHRLNRPSLQIKRYLPILPAKQSVWVFGAGISLVSQGGMSCLKLAIHESTHHFLCFC